MKNRILGSMLACFWGNLIPFIVLGAFLANVVGILAILPRCFLNMDSGFMMLLYSSQTLDSTIAANFLTIPRILFWIKTDILSYRYLRLCLDIISGLLVCYALWRWSKENQIAHTLNRIEWIGACSLILMGCLSFPADYIFYQMGHHDTTRWMGLIATAGFFISLSRFSKRWSYAVVTIVGFAVTWNFFNKPPASAMVGLLFLSAYWLSQKQGMIRAGWKWFLFFIGGVLLALLIFFVIFVSPIELIDAWKLGLFRNSLLANARLQTDSLVIQFFRDSFNIASTIVEIHGIHILVLLISMVIVRRIKNSKLRYVLYFVIGLDVTVSATFVLDSIFQFHNLLPFQFNEILYPGFGEKSYDYVNNSYPLLVLLLFGVLIYVSSFIWDSSKKSSWKKIIIPVAFLFLVPAMAGLGTNQTLAQIMRENVWAWIIILVLLASDLKKYIPERLSLWTFYLVPSLIMVFQQIYVIETRTAVIGGMEKCEQPLQGLPEARGILFPKEEADYYQELYNILTTQCDYRKGDYILGLYDLVNTVFILGGKSPGTVAYYSPRYFGEDYNIELLDIMGGEEVRQSFILSNQPIGDGMLEVLRDKGAAFPESFQYLGKVKQAYDERMVEVYAPLDRCK